MSIFRTFRTGEDIVIELDAPAGVDPATMALPNAGMLAVPKDNELAIDFALTQAGVVLAMVVAISTSPVGWMLSYGHTPTAALAPGIYAIEAAIVGATGAVKITPPIFIRVHRAIVGASATPPVSIPSLDFTDPANSMYIPLLFRRF